MRTTLETSVERYRAGACERVEDEVAEEVPVALVFHGVPHVVMLATPADLDDFAVGFALSEGLVAHAAEILETEVRSAEQSAEIHLRIAPARFSELLQRRRTLTGRTGCGLCGIETLEQALRPPTSVGTGPVITGTELHAALEELSTRQPINARTGSVHAAGWGLPGRGLQVVREDVGRHNALDKVIGALIRGGATPADGYLLITSRASFEMVQKASTVGIAFVAAVSAPTALAIRQAKSAGVTLVGFARQDQHVVYARPDRLRLGDMMYGHCQFDQDGQ